MVTLISNIPHYHHTAQALESAGLLTNYITSWALPPEAPSPWFLPALYKGKLEGRRLSSIDSRHVTSFFLQEALQKALPKTGLITADQATNLHNWMFDSSAAKKLPSAGIVHFVNSIAVKTSKLAARRGMTTVCDSRQEHPATQRRILEEECAKRQLPLLLENERVSERTIEEVNSASFLFVPSEFAKRSFVDNGFDPKRIAIVPYGVDQHMFPSSGVKAKQKMSILYVGQLNLRKGILYLLEALKQVPRSSFELTCVGALDQSIEKAVCEHQGMFTHVRSVAKRDLYRYYQDADIFILPSLSDAYPLVVLEALKSGLPVITTSNVGSCDLIAHQVNGLVVKPGDSMALAGAIDLLLSEPSLRCHMREANIMLAENIGWGQYKSALLDAYFSQVLVDHTVSAHH